MLTNCFKIALKNFESNKLFVGPVGAECVHYSDVLALSNQDNFNAAKGNLVFCLLENDISGLVGYLALLAAGAVPLVLNTSIHPFQLSKLIESYKPSFIWLPTAQAGELANAHQVLQHGEYSLLNFKSSNLAIHITLGLLLGTSGSTGSPKFVRLSRDSVYSNALAISEYLELNESDLPITTLPPSYSYGLSIIHSHVLVGATIAVTNKTFFDRAFWNFFQEINATSFSGVPYHYEILKKLRFTKMDLPSLRTLTQAGGRMDPGLTKEYATYCELNGRNFVTMYGQTEATARMSYLPAERCLRKAGSIGIPIPGGMFQLRSATGDLIEAPHTEGELIYQGPNVCMGYANGYEDLAKDDEFAGTLHTGDLAFKDEEGDYFIVGRLKRFIKIFGNRINLEDVENYVGANGHQVLCNGKDDLLEIYLLDSESASAIAIKKLVVGYLQIAVSAVSIYGVCDFPRNESGKTKYSELQPHMGILLA